MTESAFDTLARGTESRQGRRNALKAFGAAALAAAAGVPLAADAKKNGKSKKKKRKNKGGNAQVCPECPAKDCTQEAEQAVAARCQAQVKPCQDLAQTTCNGDVQCVFTFLECCEEFATCDAQGFFACLVSANS